MGTPASSRRPRRPRRTRASRGTGRAAASLVALVVLVAGCAVDAPRADPARSLTAPACLTTELLEDLGLERLDAAPAGAPALAGETAVAVVPAGFVPVGVVECAPGELLTDVKGVWDAVAVRQLEGDLDRLLAAFAAPVPTAARACPSPVAAAVSELWLVDALNQAVQVALTVDGCGSTAPAVQRAVAALTEISVSHYRVRLATARVTAAPTP